MELHGCNPAPPSSLYDSLHRAGRPSGRPPRLDTRTKLVNAEVPAGYLCQLYPGAREAVISFSSSYRPTSSGPARASPEELSDGTKAAGGTERQERRAKQSVRRYCKANGVNRLMTLTYGPPFCTDPRELRTHVSMFIRRLRRELDCRRFPYVWVPELHKDGVRLHAHIGVAQYVAKDRLQGCWPHGFVDIRRIQVKNAGSTTEQASKAAFYMAKYVGKAFENTTQVGCHRYEVGQGFQPRVDRLVLETEEQARLWAISMMGGEIPAHEWSSRDSDEWDGPECRVIFWD